MLISVSVAKRPRPKGSYYLNFDMLFDLLFNNIILRIIIPLTDTATVQVTQLNDFEKFRLTPEPLHTDLTIVFLIFILLLGHGFNLCCILFS